MKIMTIAGTRPELIRLSIIIKKLDKLVDHVLVYTNQNFTYGLRDQFFEGLKIRQPDYVFDKKDGFIPFISNAFEEFDNVLERELPDKILILGDTNSGLLALLAKRRGIPVYHMEAGNRCYDERVPEEANRRVIDSLSKYNLPYTENSKQNLLKEGYHKNYVLKTGNPIYEVMNHFRPQLAASDICERLSLTLGKFILVTAHRAENVGDDNTLRTLMGVLGRLSKDYSVVFPVHPRTRSLLRAMEYRVPDSLIMCEPLGFFDFVALEEVAMLVISDSGTVQEECCILGTPSVTIRKSTERQETIECGSNVLAAINFELYDVCRVVMSRENKWAPPSDYLIDNVSDTVINILLGTD